VPTAPELAFDFIDSLGNLAFGVAEPTINKAEKEARSDPNKTKRDLQRGLGLTTNEEDWEDFREDRYRQGGKQLDERGYNTKYGYSVNKHTLIIRRMLKEYNTPISAEILAERLQEAFREGKSYIGRTVEIIYDADSSTLQFIKSKMEMFVYDLNLQAIVGMEEGQVGDNEESDDEEVLEVPPESLVDNPNVKEDDKLHEGLRVPRPVNEETRRMSEEKRREQSLGRKGDQGRNSKLTNPELQELAFRAKDASVLHKLTTQADKELQARRTEIKGQLEEIHRVIDLPPKEDQALKNLTASSSKSKYPPGMSNTPNLELDVMRAQANMKNFNAQMNSVEPSARPLMGVSSPHKITQAEVDQFYREVQAEFGMNQEIPPEIPIINNENAPDDVPQSEEGREEGLRVRNENMAKIAAETEKALQKQKLDELYVEMAAMEKAKTNLLAKQLQDIDKEKEAQIQREQLEEGLNELLIEYEGKEYTFYQLSQLRENYKERLQNLPPGKKRDRFLDIVDELKELLEYQDE
jgi:hypothetical protein